MIPLSPLDDVDHFGFASTPAALKALSLHPSWTITFYALCDTPWPLDEIVPGDLFVKGLPGERHHKSGLYSTE